MAAFVEQKQTERRLQTTCFDLSSFETPYAQDDRSMTYSGIMFDLFTKSEALEILTLEVDVRLQEVTDFNVQVYTTDGGYLSKINDSSQWSLVADHEAIPSPDGRGIIIPQRAFENIKLGANERLSLYVQMKGPWIESTSQALTKTGELAFDKGDFSSYAGVGTSSLFPENPESTTDPQFAGKVFYQKPKACEDTAKSVVDILFLTGKAFDHSSLGPLSTSVETVANDFLMKEVWFKDKASAAGLSVLGNTKTSTEPYNGSNCPWDFCSTFTSQLAFTHSIDLSLGEIQYNVYRYADAIMREVRGGIQGNEIAYLGSKSATAGFVLTLSGVTDGQPINSEQEGYFAETLVNFLSTAVKRGSIFVDVFDAQLAKDEVVRNLRVTRNLEGTVSVEGTIYGGRAAPLKEEEFVVQVQRALREDGDTLVKTLKYGSVIPQSDLPSEEILSYFDNLSGVSGDFVDQGATDTDWGGIPFDHSKNGDTPAFGDGGNMNTGEPGSGLSGDKLKGVVEDQKENHIYIIIGAVVGALLIVATAAYVGYEVYKKKKYKEDLDLRRAKAREARIRRMSKDDSSETLKKDALKALDDLDELDEEKGARTASIKSDSDGLPECARPYDDSRGRKSRRDTASLPDAESMRRAGSRSSERPPSKHTLLASFMDDESKKRKPGDKMSGAKSLDGADFRRSVPARAFSDNPHSRYGDGPDRNIERSRSSDDLEEIRAALTRRNQDSRQSPRNNARKSRSVHSRSTSGDLAAASGNLATMAAHAPSRGVARSQSADMGSRSAHARMDAGGGLYGSEAPRRGTRPNPSSSPTGRPRGNSPTRHPPARSQSFDQRSAPPPARGNLRATHSGDLSGMRQPASGNDLAAMRASTAGPNSDQIRRGGRRNGTPATQVVGSTRERGVPQRSKSNEGMPQAPERVAPRRTKSGDL